MTVDIYSPTESDTLSATEMELYELIMQYRASLGLKEIPLSTSLTLVAGRHALDTHFNIWQAGATLPDGANLHSWSDAPYFGNHSDPQVMWDAPERLGTTYPGDGFEISAAGYSSIEEALEGWKNSPGHNAVMANTGIWANSDWNAIGVGVYQPESYDQSLPFGGMIYHVWFGKEADPAGPPILEVESDLTLTDGPDTLVFAPGDTLDVTDPADLFSDTVQNFSDQNHIRFDGLTMDRRDVTFDPATGTMGIDTDGNGTPNGSIRFEGNYSDGDFMAVTRDGGTVLSFEHFLPDLKDKQAVAAADVNGINNQPFLAEENSTDFRVTLQDIGYARYDNALGVYEIDSSGALVDVRILFENANARPASSVLVEDVEAGHELGFFLIQDAADRISQLLASDTLSFVDAGGDAGNLSDAADLQLAINGMAAGLTVFHSFDAALNSDGQEHVLSGVLPGGSGLAIGFEDQTGLGDRDYEDVVFHVEAIDPGLV